MASAIGTSTLDLCGLGPLQDFHLFPRLPPEIRIQIWKMAYDAIPDTKVYRFHLRFSFIPDLEISSDDGEETPEPQAFVVPLEEVRHLTRELRNLKRVNTESRCEAERMFKYFLSTLESDRARRQH